MYSNGIKAFIIESISEKVFLNAKQIIFLVSENFEHNKSDKTVYRHLKDLIKDNILMKYGENYKFSISYIEKIQNLSNNIQKNIFNIQHGQEILKDIHKKPIEMKFKSGIELTNFTINLTRIIRLERNSDLKQYFYFYHWSDIFTSEWKKIFSITKLHRNYNMLGCICGKTDFDKYTVEKLKNIGFDVRNVKLEKIETNNTEYYIVGNYVYSMKYTNYFLNQENNLLNDCKKGILSKKIIDFINGNNNNQKIILKIEYNKEKAKIIKNLILSIK